MNEEETAAEWEALDELASIIFCIRNQEEIFRALQHFAEVWKSHHPLETRGKQYHRTMRDGIKELAQ